MQENPFLEIAERLSRIEHCLLDLSQQSKEGMVSSNKSDGPLTVQQAAEYLCLSTPTIYTKVSRGELPFMKRGKRLYFSRIELSEYLKAGHNATNSEIISGASQYLTQTKRRQL